MKTTMPIAKAAAVAQAILEALRPGTSRIEIVGSVRRQKPMVGDIELLAIPLQQPTLFAMEDARTQLDPILDDLVIQGRPMRLKDGPKFKQFYVDKAGCQLDLFLVRPETWGVQCLIRTGPADFSKRCVTQRQQGGYLRDGFVVKDGLIWDGQVPLETPEEQDVFRLGLGMEWIKPEDRR